MSIATGLIAAAIYLYFFGRGKKDNDGEVIAIALWTLGIFLMFSGIWTNPSGD